MLDVVWGVFALVNLLAMIAFPEWETVPFHFIWVSLTLVYGFRVWRTGGTAWTLAAVIALTGLVLVNEVGRGSQPPDEMTEVPLMACMFVAMVWHARRRFASMRDVQRISDENGRLLEREKQFVQDASHHLRTPIAIALGHAELIARGDRPDSTSEDAHVVVEELQRLRRLADLLLRIVGAEESHDVTRAEVDVDVMVVETLRRWMPTPRDWRVGALDAAAASADPDQLQLALDELIQNAVTHTRPGDRITLEVRATAGRAVICVADSGTGIEPHDLNRIFDRFVQAGSAADRRTGGFGLGLPFVRSVAESHGGSAHVESTVGEGSVFELWLPTIGGAVTDPEADAAAAPASAPAASAEPEPAPVVGS
jgi:signal transduction histidine kinase